MAAWSESFDEPGARVSATWWPRTSKEQAAAVLLGAHHHNARVVAVLPGEPGNDNCAPVAASVAEALSGAVYYEGTLRMDQLLAADCLPALVGAAPDAVVTGVSVGARADLDVVVGLRGHGLIRLAISPHVYEELGLTGSESVFLDGPRGKGRHATRRRIVDIDVGAPGFTDTKAYARLIWCFRDRTEPVTLLVACEVGGVCREIAWSADVASVNRYTTAAGVWPLAGFEVPQRPPRPESDDPGGEAGDDDDDVEDFVNWMALAVLCARGEARVPTADSGISEMACDLPLEARDLQVVVVDGLVTATAATAALDLVDDWAAEAGFWAMVSAVGFPDSPWSWGAGEHSFVSSGDNVATVVADGAGGPFVGLLAFGERDQAS